MITHIKTGRFPSAEGPESSVHISFSINSKAVERYQFMDCSLRKGIQRRKNSEAVSAGPIVVPAAGQMSSYPRQEDGLGSTYGEVGKESGVHFRMLCFGRNGRKKSPSLSLVNKKQVLTDLVIST